VLGHRKQRRKIIFKPQRRRERREKKEILPVTLKGLVVHRINSEGL